MVLDAGNPNSYTKEVENNKGNSEYDDVEEIAVYLDADTFQFMVDYLPIECRVTYRLSLNKNTNMASFSYYGKNNNSAQAQFSSDVFYEVKDMVFMNQIEPYVFPTDENGKRIDTVEPIYVTINYKYDDVHTKFIGIKKPDNIDAIITRLDELAQSAK